VPSQAYVSIEIADTGVGMAPEVLRAGHGAIFHDQGGGKGTGLGLSQVYGFVQQSEGFLHIDSTRTKEPESAYTFRGRRSCRGNFGNDRSCPWSGRVLVVEDDDDVRSLVVAQLEDLGYFVNSAASGPAALEYFAAAERPRSIC